METTRTHPTSPRPGSIPQGLSRIAAGSAGANLRVRPASPLDRPLLEAMLLRSATGLPGGRFRRGARARREARRRIAQERSAWIAIAAGGVRGVVTVTTEPDGSADAEFLVEDEWRHSGVATALAAAVEGLAQTRSSESMSMALPRRTL
jgi:hypothetical protein